MVSNMSWAILAVLVSAAPAAAQITAPTVPSVAVGSTAAGRDLIDLNSLPPARNETGLTGSAAADAAFGKAGAADTGTAPAPRHGVERNVRANAKAATTPPR